MRPRACIRCASRWSASSATRPRPSAAPIAAPMAVDRVKGFVGVESRGNLEIKAGEVSNATPVDVRALPAAILGITSQPVLLGYKYLGEDAADPADRGAARGCRRARDATRRDPRAHDVDTRGPAPDLCEISGPQQPASVPAPGATQGGRAVERLGRRPGSAAGAGQRCPRHDPAGPVTGRGWRTGGLRGRDRVRRGRRGAQQPRSRKNSRPSCHVPTRRAPTSPGPSTPRSRPRCGASRSTAPCARSVIYRTRSRPRT